LDAVVPLGGAEQDLDDRAARLVLVQLGEDLVQTRRDVLQDLFQDEIVMIRESKPARASCSRSSISEGIATSSEG
jgi:hypothetical protein